MIPADLSVRTVGPILHKLGAVHLQEAPSPPTSLHSPSLRIYGRLNYESLTSSFPSPQEFESAPKMHDHSIPASLTSTGVARKLHEQHSRLLAGTSFDGAFIDSRVAISTPPSIPGPQSDAIGVSTSPVCPSVTRHPMHTYIIPQLCYACVAMRQENLARFEQKALEDAMDPENGGYRRGCKLGNMGDSHRKRIHRRTAGKGKLIPLICVEEGRIGLEMLAESKLENVQLRSHESDDKAAPAANAEYSTMITGLLEKDGLDNADTGLNSTVRKDTAGVNGFQTKSIVDSQISLVPAATANIISAWGRSRWGRSNAPLSSETATFRSASSVPPPPGHTDGETSQMFLTIPVPVDLSQWENGRSHLTDTRNKSPILLKRHTEGVDWFGTTERRRRNDSDVARDNLGRNASGMNKIMGF